MSDTPPRRRRAVLQQERSRQRRAIIARAAMHHWASDGFDNTTIDRICNTAGVSRRLFYSYFADKEDLLLELGRETAVKIGTDAERLLREDLELDVFFDRLLELFGRRVERTPPLVLESAVLKVYRLAAAPPTHKTDGPQLHDLMTKVFVDAVAQKKARPETDCSMMGDIVACLMFECVRQWAADPDRSTRSRSLTEELRAEVGLVVAGVIVRRRARSQRRSSKG